VRRTGQLSTVELVDLLRQRAQPRGYMAAFGGTIGLLDAMIHQQDIRRPLGIAGIIYLNVSAPRSVPGSNMHEIA
jgi:hypothetical protein